ncbi:MAG: hypothetical protein BM564_01260 [Bacteroidetes bacterium MedPE-SWsnd-G2]|nr:MAG: hypothetical protein BM564_01260 [Bacteroidetes bacterium MedPE-SWsnd-G2]
MNRIIVILLVQLIGFQTLVAQDLDNLSFGSDDTFEILTWNIENFPKNGETTVNYVIDIIEALDVDILAIQEVDNISVFDQMISDLSGYDGYLESVWFAGLAYIYKSDTIEINSLYEIFTSAEFWNYFPRSPMVMDLDFMGQRYIIINNHYKCCGDGVLDLDNNTDEETRRYYANFLLKEYVDTNFADENVIILGDLNDNITDDSEHNVFQMILDDDNYTFVDYDIASGSNTYWSYPSWPSHLDHILINNPLFDEFQNPASDIQTIKVDDYLTDGWLEYDEHISDHRPVALKLEVENNLSASEPNTPKSLFINYPNPFKTETTIRFNITSEPHHIEIYNLNGQKLLTKHILVGQSSTKLNLKNLSPGIYFAKLVSHNTIKATQKLVIIK